jgi:peptide/nickel transport system permease protein
MLEPAPIAEDEAVAVRQGDRRTILRYMVARLVAALLTLVLISFATYMATAVLPGDPARAALGRNATPEQRAEYRERLGLDRPVLVRYWDWVSGMVRGDWGTSLVSGRPVTEDVLPRIARTVAITFAAMLFAIPLALFIGSYTGRRNGGALDVSVSIGSLLVASQPEFILGVILLYIFGVRLGVLPIESSGVAFNPFAVKGYILPTMTLALVILPYITRMTRASVRDEYAKTYVRAARLRGLGERSILWGHAMPNASVPIVNVILLNVADLAGGVVVVENLFVFPGIGQLLVDAIHNGDTPTVQAVAVIVGALVIIANFLADVAILILSPRLREAG